MEEGLLSDVAVDEYVSYPREANEVRLKSVSLEPSREKFTIGSEESLGNQPEEHRGELEPGSSKSVSSIESI